MNATFKGFISVDQNAVFSVEKLYGATVISENFFKLKDGINADAFIIGRTYNISGITK